MKASNVQRLQRSRFLANKQTGSKRRSTGGDIKQKDDAPMYTGCGSGVEVDNINMLYFHREPVDLH